jgi:hypothetical protein
MCGCVSKTLTPGHFKTHDDIEKKTVKEFTANRCPIFKPGTADDS